MKTECPREVELLEALARGFVPPDLDAHAGECLPCGELRLVAGALIDDRIDAIREAPVPSAGTMWLRMQMRRNQETQARARRSLMIGQAATLVIAIAMLISLFGGDLATGARDVIASVRGSTPLLIVLATWLLATPIAGWVAVRQR